jgi:hypothetical protein
MSFYSLIAYFFLLLNNIPLHGRTTVCLFIQKWMLKDSLGAGGMVQVIEHLPSMLEVLSLNPIMTKKQK